jgi:hypothetical protein
MAGKGRYQRKHSPEEGVVQVCLEQRAVADGQTAFVEQLLQNVEGADIDNTQGQHWSPNKHKPNDD